MTANILLRVFNRIGKLINSLLYHDQWIIMTMPGEEYSSLDWKKLKPIIPPPDRYWADPFVMAKDNRYYIFIEEKIYQTRLGHISCLTLDGAGNVLANQAVLQKPYHISYPFLFEYEDQLYMLPETAQNRKLGVYRCRHFPNEWDFVGNLMADMHIVDGTLFEHDGKWWLFANIKEEGGSSWDSLYLFYADSPLSESWTPHPMNPIVKDIHSARPAGNIFIKDGKLIRPSQDCSKRYGYAIRFNEIVKLTGTEYAEVHLHTFKPLRGGEMIATHTFNRVQGMLVVDAEIRHKKQKLF